MRIRYLADIRFPLERANGVQTMETCHALARRGHHVRLVVRPDSHVPARDPFDYYGLPRVAGLVIEPAATPESPLLRRAGYLAQALRVTLGADDVDVILTRDLTVAAWLAAVPAAMRPPLVYESHGFAPVVSAALPDLLSAAPPPTDAKARRLERRERRIWRAADGYVTITQGLLEELTARFGPRASAAVVADGARVPEVMPPARARTAGTGRLPVVGYAGHLYPWKGVDVLLHALSRLPGARALVIGGLSGEPDLARVRALAQSLAPGRVTCVGHLDPPRVGERLQEADVLVIPNPPTRVSAAYTSPLKLFEYMASGRPIVASDLPALREVLVDGDSALLVEAGSADALAAGLARVLDDPALAARLAARAFERVREYSWDRRAERLEALLRVASRAPESPRRLA